MTIKEALVKLLKVKSLVTIALIVTFCALAFTGVISGEQVNNIVMIVVSFYFGTQLEKSKETSGKDDVQ